MSYADIGTARVRAQHYEGHPSEDARRYDHVGGDGGGDVVGGIAGHHTVTDVRDLAATIDFRIRATDALVAKHGLSSALPAVVRWTSFKDRWQSASRRILLALSNQVSSARIVPADKFPAESEYQELRCAINKSCDDTHADPGDMFNAIAGVEVAAQERIDERNHPQPTGGDPDLAIFQKLDAAIRASEAAARPPPKPWYAFPWWVYALSITFVGGIGYSFYRVAKKARVAEGSRPLGAHDMIPRMLPAPEHEHAFAHSFAHSPAHSPAPAFAHTLARDPVTGVVMPPSPSPSPSFPSQMP
jgi:cbb3-type cytochrome oxidase subunit 3